MNKPNRTIRTIRLLKNEKRFCCGLLIPFSFLVFFLAHRNPQATERWFSNGIYRFIAATYGRVFGYLPFSVSQFLIIILPVCAIIYIVYEIYCIAFKHGQRKRHAKRMAANTLCALGIICFVFMMGAGLNYARLELSEILDLDVRPSPVEELTALTEILVQHANEFSTQVARNEYGNMVISAGDYATLSRQAQDIFRGAGEEFPVLSGFAPLAKPIIYSQFMSRLRIVGIYSPFTMEAHVNVHVMDYHIPATMLHELAHFRGIMREDEANFIAWLTGMRSSNPDFMYSVTMLALSYTAGQLHRVNRDEHSRIMAGLNAYVQADRLANWEYWRQFEGQLAEISRAANDAYLRVNRIEDGVHSYGRMVDLLLAYFRNYNNSKGYAVDTKIISTGQPDFFIPYFTTNHSNVTI